MNAYLNIKDVNVKLGDFSLSHLDLSIERNEYMVLLGPTGSGKTSLLKTLVGIISTEKGDIILGERSIADAPTQKRNIGYVSQMTDLFPHLTVRNNVGFSLRYQNVSRDEKRERINRLMGLFGLEHLSERDVSTLSGGETKKVSIARSLAASPDLLLLDEPLGMLDHNARQTILKTLRLIHTELKTTTIHVTHDRSEAWAVGESCAVICRGTIRQKGTVSDVFRKPATKFVAEFLGGTNLLPAQFTKKNGAGYALIDNESFKTAFLPDFKQGYLLIRPEHIHIAGRSETETAHGRITELADRGTHCLMTVRTSSSHKLIAFLPFEKMGRLHKDDEVHLEWDPADAWPVREDGD